MMMVVVVDVRPVDVAVMMVVPVGMPVTAALARFRGCRGQDRKAQNGCQEGGERFHGVCLNSGLYLGPGRTAEGHP